MYSFRCSRCWLTNETVDATTNFTIGTHKDDKKYLILCFFSFFLFQNKQHTSDALNFSNWKIYIIFSFTPSRSTHVLAPFSCPEMLLIRTGHMKMMLKAGNIAGGKRQILENETGIHLHYNIITRLSTGILYKIQT